MEKIKLLTILVGITLVLSAVNLYSTFTFYQKFDSTIGKIFGEEGSVPKDKDSKAPSKVEVSVDDDAVRGSNDAPITIIEFSDFQCPFCEKFFNDTLPELEETYIKTGKVKLVYRDFPLSFHENAQKAAEAAECAKKQGKFWEMHDKIFKNQESLSIDNLKQYAKDLELNSSNFDACLDSGEMESEVQKDFKDGQSYGVTGTPSFFINGIQLVGAQPFSAFEKIIEEELK